MQKLQKSGLSSTDRIVRKMTMTHLPMAAAATMTIVLRKDQKHHVAKILRNPNTKVIMLQLIV